VLKICLLRLGLCLTYLLIVSSCLHILLCKLRHVRSCSRTCCAHALLLFRLCANFESELTSHNCDVPVRIKLRVSLQAVQIDPDAEAGETDSKSAAAALCGGPPKADKPFDF